MVETRKQSRLEHKKPVIDWEAREWIQVGPATLSIHVHDLIMLNNKKVRTVVDVNRTTGELYIGKRESLVVNAPIKVFCPHLKLHL